MTIERRNDSGEVEFRAEGDSIRAEGYAAKFDVFSQDLGGFVERIRPEAFDKTIQEADVRALFNHDPNFLLGTVRAGTLGLEVDETGLRYSIDLPDTQIGRDVAALLERRDLRGSSFGFRVIRDHWTETESGYPQRDLQEVALRDVGPVTFPAYIDTEAALRSLAEAIDAFKSGPEGDTTEPAPATPVIRRLAI